MASKDSFGAKGSLDVGGTSYEIFRLDAVTGDGLDVASLPYSLKVLLENLLRTEDGADITEDHIRALAGWDADADPDKEIQFTPARVIMQDFTGVPCVVDLATMREAMADLGGDPTKINPLAPAELVIDHSVIADVFGTPEAFERNVEIEYERNRERYQFLRWGQGAFEDFKVVPPGTGIVHQVNIEHLARVVFTREIDGELTAYPDTCVGTDTHTTMVNGIGVVGWGVGGIEAEAAMLGQPVSHADPARRRLQAQRRPARGRDRHRPGAHHHRDAAQARRGREVRRVLRPRRLGPAAGQPGHDRQHEPGVRLHDRGLPDRRGDHQVPQAHRPHRGAARAGRGLRQGAGALARPRRRAALLREARARPGDRRAVPGRPEAAAGPGLAVRGQGRRSAVRWPTTPTAAAAGHQRATTRRSRSPSRPPTRRANGHGEAAPERLRLRAPRPTAAGRATRRWSPSRTAPSSRSTTAPSRSRRSRRAPTPPTPR